MQLSLHNGSSSGVTIISNIFIDYYMPRANGEFVKIYLYLLRSLQSGDTALDLAAVADVFDCTESDVLRTLRYWENQKLVVLAGTDTQTSIDFLQPMVPDTVQNTLAEQAITQISPATSTNTVTSGSPSTAGASVTPARNAPQTGTQPSQTTGNKKTMSADRLKELREQEDVRQILFLAESYLGTTLSRTVTDELLYIYEELHFSVDLFDYLIEYCVSKGSKDIHYTVKPPYLPYGKKRKLSLSSFKNDLFILHLCRNCLFWRLPSQCFQLFQVCMDLPLCIKLIVVFCPKILIFHTVFQDMINRY